MLALLLLIALAVSGHADDAALSQFFKTYLDHQFQMRPLLATQLGDHRFDAQLDEVSAEARQRWTQWDRETLAQLPRAVRTNDLSPAARVDYEILRHQLEYALWLADNVHPFETDPRVYNDYISDSVFLLLSQSTLPSETNVSNAIARMRQIPRVLAAARANLRRPPRVHTETAIRQNRGAIAYYEKDVFHLVGKTAKARALKEEAQRVVSALRVHQNFLEHELLPRADGDWRMGPDRFARKLELELDAGLSAADVLAMAETEFLRVQGELYVLARQLWSRCYPRQPLPPDDAEGRRATVQRVLQAVAQDHGRPEHLTRDVRKTVAQIRNFITDHHVLRLPQPDRCRIIEMPEFQRGNATAYMNSPPPLDPHATGYYAVSPPPKDWDAARVKSYLEEYNRHMLQILTIHEAYPGHYVQFEYANRNPSLIRRVLSSGVYVEGWAVYTEQTLLDQGYGAGDLPLRLTQLKFYLRAVVNAILDHKMHCAGMTDDQAMDLLVNQAYQSEGEARLKVIRSKQSSVQLSSYFAGRMAHYRLRQQVQRDLGNAFNLADYHEAVLAEAAVPMRLLPNLVRVRLKLPR